MKRKLLALSSPVGMIIFLIYAIGKRFIGEYPDIVAYPMMVISVVLMMIGIAYNGYCFGKIKSPYDFKS